MAEWYEPPAIEPAVPEKVDLSDPLSRLNEKLSNLGMAFKSVSSAAQNFSGYTYQEKFAPANEKVHTPAEIAKMVDDIEKLKVALELPDGVI